MTPKNKKKSQIENLHQEDIHRSVLETLPSPICRFLLTGQLTFTNEAYRHYMRHCNGRVEGGFFSCISDSDKALILDKMRGLSNKRSSFVLEHGIDSQDGSGQYWQWNIQAVSYNKKGNPLEFQALGIDATDNKSIQEDLLKFKSGIEHSDQPIFMTDVKGRIIYANPVFENLYDYSIDQILGKMSHFLDVDDGADEAYLGFQKMLTQQAVVNTERVNRTREGALLNIMQSISPIYNHKEVVIGFLFIQSDITKDKAVQRKLMETEGKYRDIVEHSPNIIYSVNEKGLITFANQRIYDFLDYSQEEIIGRPVKNLYSPALWRKIRQDFKNYDQSNPPSFVEGKMIKKNGETIEVAIDSITVSDDRGFSKEMRSIVRDISANKKIELQLKQSEEKYRDIIENSSEMIHSVDDKGIILFANQTEHKILGYKPGELIGRSIQDIYPPQLIGKVKAGFGVLKKKGKLILPYAQMQTKSGDLIDVEVNSVAVRDDKGKFLHTRSIILDVTERKKAEEALRKAHDELELRVEERTSELQLAKEGLEREKSKAESLLNSIGEGILSIDLKGRLNMINPTAEQMFDVSSEKLLGKQYSNYFKFEDKKGDLITCDSFPIKNVIDTKKQIYTTTFFMQKDGARLPLATTFSPVLFDNQLLGIIGTFRDITREMEIDQAKDEFVSLASHQLQTPLTAISWLLQILIKDKNWLEWQGEILNDAFESTHRMIRLVDDFLNVSRLDMNSIGVVSKKINLVKFINQLIREVQVLANENNQSIKLIIPKKVIMVSLDTHLVGQVILNLLSNAIKYSRPKKTITISLKLNKASVDIIVKDQGIGISEKDQKNLFTKFFRTNQGSKYSATGSGLGLYIIKKVLKVCDGSVSVKSAVGKGTTFIVSLPLKGPTHHLGNEKQLSTKII